MARLTPVTHQERWYDWPEESIRLYRQEQSASHSGPDCGDEQSYYGGLFLFHAEPPVV